MQIESMDVTDADLIRGETLEGGNSKLSKEKINPQFLHARSLSQYVRINCESGETACKLLTMVTNKYIKDRHWYMHIWGLSV